MVTDHDGLVKLCQTTSCSLVAFFLAFFCVFVVCAYVCLCVCCIHMRVCLWCDCDCGSKRLVYPLQ